MTPNEKDTRIEQLEAENSRLKKALVGAGKAGEAYEVSRSGNMITISKEYYIELLEDKVSLMRSVCGNEDLFLLKDCLDDDGGES